jgi:hypothetical protein
MPSKFGPLKGSFETTPCPACDQPFLAGQYITFVALGPGASADDRKRAREGRPYNAVAVQVHYACATGDES